MRSSFLLSCLLLLFPGISVGQYAVVYEGKRAVQYDGTSGWFTRVVLSEQNGEAALGFTVQHNHRMSNAQCWGLLYVTAARLIYEPDPSIEDRSDAFDIERSAFKNVEIKRAFLTKYPHLELVHSTSGKKYVFFVREFCPAGVTCPPSAMGARDREIFELFERSIRDFENMLRDIQQMTADLQMPPTGNVSELREGQSVDEVVAIMGEPAEKITVKETLIFIYSTVRLVFVAGKLTEIQPR